MIDINAFGIVMTAIVGILNKRATVMAADSADTMSNDKGVKIYATTKF